MTVKDTSPKPRLPLLIVAGLALFALSATGTIGTPVALTSLAFLAGLLLLPFGIETKGHVLPE